MDLSESPSLSHDGKVIAYSSDRAETGNIDIFTQRFPGGRAIRITTNVAQDDNPSLSPDGTSVVFRSERNSGGIYMSSVDGGQEHIPSYHMAETRSFRPTAAAFSFGSETLIHPSRRANCIYSVLARDRPSGLPVLLVTHVSHCGAMTGI